MNIEELKNNPAKLEQIAKVSFNDFDKNKNGKLEFSEIYKVLEGFSSNNSLVKPSKDEVKKTFDHLDLDKDGRISFAEYKKLFEQYILSYKS